MSPSCRSFLRCIVACCAMFAATGCSAKPELRAIGAPAAAVSIGEGKGLLEQGRAVEAVAAFRALLRRNGDDLQGLNGLAIAYSELGRPDLAAEMFARALAMAPDDPATLNNIGFAALRRANTPLARHYLKKASGRNSDHQEILGNLEGLAFLEAIDRGAYRSASKLGRTFDATSDSSPVVRRIAYRSAHQSDDPETASPVSPTPQLNASPTAMVDFTAVVDPFPIGERSSDLQ